MLKKWSKKKIVIVLLSFTVLSGLVFLPVVYSLSDKLSETTRVNANVLVVEGWLSQDAIELTYNEFMNNEYDQIITTGTDLISHEYYMVSSNGYLIFYPPKKKFQDNAALVHEIGVDCYSELGGENSSQFNVYVNDSLIANYTANKRRRKYVVTWEGKLKDIDSIMVQFINDGVGDYGDRNLYVKQIIIDNDIIIPYQYNSVYDISMVNGKRRMVNSYNSYAQLGRRRLLSFGLDSSLVIAVPGKRVKLNRTLSSVLAFRDWLKTSDIEVKGINIVTLGAHAERTWMTYNKILDKKYKIGIISLPDYKASHSRKYKVLKTIRESIGIVYYWFILLPY